jgi:dienelactone hydrolase
MMIRIAALTAILLSLPAVLPAWELPRPTGAHPVGRRLMYWQRGADQWVVTWVWYPAAVAPRTSEPVLPEGWSRLRQPTLQRRLGPEAAVAFTAARQWFRPDAPIATTPDMLPVLVLSPGLSWLPVDYSALAAELASRGYVVFGVAPAGFAGPVVLPGGEVAGQIRGPGDQVYWEEDLRFALARIADLQTAEDSPFRGRLTLDRIGLFGHSMGGAASMAVAAGNSQVAAAANLDGDFMGPARDARPLQPLLLLSHREPAGSSGFGGSDPSEGRRTRDWNAVASQSQSAQRFALNGSSHLDFLDAALLPPAMIPPKLRENRFSDRPGIRTLALTARLLDDFFSGRPVATTAARFPELAPLLGRR